jgi:AcrR family transcriptional regulator
MNQIRPDTRTAILEAGFQVFNKRPGASLGDVADHAGVGRATLHRHFASREALMLALALAAMDELNTAVDAATADAESYSAALKQALFAIVPLGERQAFLASDPVQNDPEISAAYARDMDALRHTIEAARAEGLFSAEAPTEWIAQSYNTLIYAAWEMVRDGHATHRQAADLAWRTLINGLKGNSDER